MKSTYRTCAWNCSNRYTNTNTNTDYLALLIPSLPPNPCNHLLLPPWVRVAVERRGRGRAFRDVKRTQMHRSIVTTCHAMLRYAVVFTICSRDASVTSLSFSLSLLALSRPPMSTQCILSCGTTCPLFFSRPAIYINPISCNTVWYNIIEPYMRCIVWPWQDWTHFFYSVFPSPSLSIGLTRVTQCLTIVPIRWYPRGNKSRRIELYEIGMFRRYR